MNQPFFVKTYIRLLLLFILFSLFVWGSYNRIQEAYLVYREKETGEERVRILEERKNELGREADTLGNLFRIEREAKERFNLKLPGEKVVVILPDEPAAPEGQAQGASLWFRIKSFFIGTFGR